ncbi:MAG: riboflavin kinase/FMN adenylyltransferase [Cognaticolwellia sp.]|jgi:riboflavin kinase/FMN adenylyltransferase
MSMKIYQGSESFPASARPVLTIGNFDGVHLGHQQLLGALVKRASELDRPAAVYTFEPAPRRVLQPESCPPRILSITRKLELLERLGVQQVILEAFTLDLGSQTAAWFADEVIGRRLHPAEMVVGYDFRYGHKRSGDVNTLRTHFPELPVHAVTALTGDREHIVSSSVIRVAVAEGRVAEAASFLGRPYRLSGTVISGDKRGRTLGFATANLEPDQELLPALGVYAVRAGVTGQPKRPAVANLGVRPTFDRKGVVLEVHILDSSPDLYGAQLQVDFVAHLRDEKRFESREALQAQIALDIHTARGALGAQLDTLSA